MIFVFGGHRLVWACRSLATYVSVAAILNINTALAAEDHLYRVRPGDTLIGISRKLLEDPHDWLRVQHLNQISEPRRMRAGRVLLIPAQLLRRPTEGKITAITGDVRIGGRPASLDDRIIPGNQVTTGAQSFITIELADGSRLTLQPSSRMQVESLHRPRGGSTRLNLQSGRLESNVTPKRGPQPHFVVVTPSATIGVRGTVFRVGADEDTSRAEVTTGSIIVQGVHDRHPPPPLLAGYGLVVDGNGYSGPSTSLLPPPSLTELPTFHEKPVIRFPVPVLPGAESYRAQIAPDSDMRQIVAEMVTSGPEIRFINLADGNYTLQVRGIDRLGLEGYDARLPFQLQAHPEPPFPQSPVSDQKLFGDAPELSWSEAVDASRYQIQLADDYRFIAPLVDIENIESTKIVPTAKLIPKEYYWRVRSIGANGQAGPWSDQQRFIMRPAPAGAMPPDLNERELHFTWPGEPGQTFLFQFARNDQFADPLIEQQLGNAQTTLPRPEAGIYYARVRATDPDGFIGPFSTTQIVRVEPLPPPKWLLLFLLAPLFL